MFTTFKVTFLPATDTRGARIKVTDTITNTSKVVPFDYSESDGLAIPAVRRAFPHVGTDLHYSGYSQNSTYVTAVIA